VVVGGLTIATVLTLFVVPIVYVLMDRLCVKFTGTRVAHGLIRAAEIERETIARPSRCRRTRRDRPGAMQLPEAAIKRSITASFRSRPPARDPDEIRCLIDSAAASHERVREARISRGRCASSL